MTFLSKLTTTTLLAGVFAQAQNTSSAAPTFSTDPCVQPATRLYIPDAPHDNYFYSDCHSSTHVVVTNPRDGANSGVRNRLLVAWPAGNSGAMGIFAAEDDQSGALTMRLENSTSSGESLDPINESDRVGISGSINFNVAARLTVPVLGSVRAIRDETEGIGVSQEFQNSFGFATHDDGSAAINRTWFDNITTTWLTFTPLNGAKTIVLNREEKWTLTFGAGTYRFDASFNYPQLEQLAPQEVLDEASSSLIKQNSDETTSLSFLSYTDKLLAGTWRFLTYFGRDSMISLLLMQPIMSKAAIEAIIGAVLERVNRTDGTVCHEEVLGDYATYLNRQVGIASSSPGCDYKMVDTDFFLPIVMKNYFVDTESGKSDSESFFSRTASFLHENRDMTYAELAQLTAEKIIRVAAPFAESQVAENLIRLNEDVPVGEWRDSSNGLGGGRIPYDVNAALVPAALRAIAALSRAGFFPDHADWKDIADQYAQTWEDSTLRFFEVTVPESAATSLIQEYIASDLALSVLPFNASQVTSNITYYGLALNGTLDTPIVPVMNSDDAFRHFLLNTTNDSQLSAYLSQTAEHILAPFPVGLSTGVGLLVANPAYAGDAAFTAGFSRDDYHGTVVWSWQLAMMGAGLARQLARCAHGTEASTAVPAFCRDAGLYDKLRAAYTALWDAIDANRAQLGLEVWSWQYGDGGYQVVPLGDLTATESNVRQLWSLTFLAVQRENFGEVDTTSAAAGEHLLHRGAWAGLLSAVGMAMW